jgi:hypothetical protein
MFDLATSGATSFTYCTFDHSLAGTRTCVRFGSAAGQSGNLSVDRCSFPNLTSLAGGFGILLHENIAPTAGNIAITNSIITTASGTYDNIIETTTPGSVTMTGNTIAMATKSTYVAIASTNAGNFTFSNNIFTVTATDQKGGLIYTTLATNPTVCDNIIYTNGTSTNTLYHINIESSAGSSGSKGAVTVARNIIGAKRATLMIGVGRDAATAGTGDNAYSSVTVEKNILYCPSYYDSTYSTYQVHGILVGFQGLATAIRYNYIYSSVLGIVFKGDSTDVSTSEGVHHNVIRDIVSHSGGTGDGIYLKGVVGAKVYNNTVYGSSAAKIQSCLHIGKNTANSTVNLIKNNIFYGADGSNLVLVDASNSGTFANNAYYNDTGTGLDFSYQGTTYSSLAAWKAAVEPTAIGTNPKLAHVPTDLYLTAGSSCIGTGLNLGTAYDDFLHPLSSITTISRIFLIQQRAIAWDIGAYKYIGNYGLR